LQVGDFDTNDIDDVAQDAAATDAVDDAETVEVEQHLEEEDEPEE
jgi:hypothetical protein